MPNQETVDNGQVNKQANPATQPDKDGNKDVDIVTRVTQTNNTEPNQQKEQKDKFDFKDIESIQDPKAKEVAMKAYKSFQSDYTQKTTQLADERKSLADLRKMYESGQSNWTPEKVQGLLKDPNFVNAAQNIVGAVEQTDNDTSILSDAEKAKIDNANKLAQQAIRAQAEALKMQQDEVNKRKYANYDPIALDEISADLLSGKVKATREYLYKATMHDENVRRAYELGKKDALGDNTEKINSMSATGIATTKNNDAPMPEKGESNRAFIARLFQKNLHASQNK